MPRMPAEALQSLNVAIAYSERQGDSELSTIRALEQHERQLERTEDDQVVQIALDNWLTTGRRRYYYIVIARFDSIWPQAIVGHVLSKRPLLLGTPPPNSVFTLYYL
jgi:hypothetical protein